MKPSTPSARRILVVDDQADNRTLACKVLRRAGYEPIEADRAEGLFELVLERRIELILMDIELPGISGLDAVRIFRADPRTASIPIIALTAYAMNEDREQCLRSGCCEYLSKPLDLGLLVQVVRQHLKGIQ